MPRYLETKGPAYLAGKNFEYDIFFSYRRADNIDNAGVPAISHFAKKITELVRAELNREIRVHWDEDDPDNAVDGDFRKRASKSATFVQFKSPAYFEREYCRREILGFLEKQPSSRVYPVLIKPSKDYIPYNDNLVDSEKSIRRREREALFFEKENMHGIFDKEGLYSPGKKRMWVPSEVEYTDHAASVAERIGIQLANIMEGAGVSDRQPAASSKSGGVSAIYLAEPSEDLWKEYWICRHHFKKRGIEVFPKTLYPDNSVAYPDFVNEDLERCQVYVQLLGKEAGRQFGEKDTVVTMQSSLADQAKKNGRGGGLKIRRWLSPEIDQTSIENFDDDYSEFVKNVRKKSIGIDQFNNSIYDIKIDELTDTDADAKAPPKISTAHSLFAVFEKVDEPEVMPDITDELAKRFDTIHFNSGASLEDEKYVLYLEKISKLSDKVVFFQAGGSSEWLQSNLHFYVQALAKLGRDDSRPASLVYKTLPQSDDKLPGIYGNIECIWRKNGFDAADI